MRRSVLLLLLCVLAFTKVDAQRYMGIATSNWSGLSSMYLNPANIGDSRYKLCVDVTSFNFGFDNDIASIKLGSAFQKYFQGKNVQQSDIFNFSNANKLNFIAPYVELRLPSISYTINPRHSVALSYRIRLMSQVTNFDVTLFQQISKENFTLGSDTSIAFKNFNFTAHLWEELGLTYSFVAIDKKMHQLKLGVTLRYLNGIKYATVKSNNVDLKYYVSKDSFQAVNSDVQLMSNYVSSAATVENSTLSAVNDLFNYGLFRQSGGIGFGGDLGIVYEFRPKYKKYRYEMDGKKYKDPTRNKYKLRASIAVTDIGYIKYDNHNTVFTGRGDGHLTSNDFTASDINKFLADKSYLRTFLNNHGFGYDSGTQATLVHMPMTFVAGVDYKITGPFYVNITYMQNLADRFQAGNSFYDQVTVSPRFDTRLFGLTVPFTYSSLTSNFKAGVGLRLSSFYIGSDDMLALFNDDQKGLNLYSGLSLPIHRHRIRDHDKDGVSDEMDKCPYDKGDLSADGCPDRDHDGVPDAEDKCPDMAGEADLDGCPDRDGDGIADYEDKCPDQAGLAQFKGCPDTDKDGVPDNEDKCPDKPGPVKMNGCPDADGDGITDADDACPDKPGPATLHGCPDTDNDGIPDNEDQCPNQPGLASNRGCPMTDTLAAPANVPEIKMVDVQKQIEFAAHSVQFESGKSILKKESYKALDEVAKILNQDKDSYLTIDGYTDNVGKPEGNMNLSASRANAVKAFLTKRGIPASRLIASGHGDTSPIAENTTADGRAKNRRVELQLKSSK